jgi:MoxR-like ATPase
VKVEASLQKYILNLVRASREAEEVSLGVSPRGTVALQRTAQALAYLDGREYVIPDDVKYLAPHVLAHRLIPAGGRRAKSVVEQLLRSVSIP